MSFLLSDGEFVEARRAVREGEITPELYGWLGRLIGIAQATHALAPAPVPGGGWDDRDAVAETLHAWLEESLLRGGLQSAFDRCDSPRALSRYLERSLRNWLVARSRRAIGPRLLERAGELLSDPRQGFVLVADARAPADRWWGLAEWRPLPTLFSGDDQAIVAAAWALGDFAILRYPSSERSDPVLSTPDLHRFLRGLLEQVGSALSGRHFNVAFRGRFAYAYAQPNAALDDLGQTAGEESTEQSFEVDESARLALVALTGRQARVLVERPQRTLEDLAVELGVSRGTIDNEYRRALLKIRESSSSDEQFDVVLEKVLEMASEVGHNDD